MKAIQARLVVIFLALLTMTALGAGQAGASTDPGLGTAGSFGVLGKSNVTNTGPTVINGNLGVSPTGAIVGFDGGPGSVNPPGTIHENDAVAAQAQSDLTDGYINAAGSACDQVLTGTDLGGLTLVPGTYCFATSAQLTGALTLNTQGNPDSVFIFKIGSTLTTASNSSVGFINGPSCRVYWQVGSSATLGTGTQFTGSVLAMASITAVKGATVEGRLLARDGAVTLDSNTVTKPSCTPAETPEPDPSPDPVVTPEPSTPAPTSTTIGPDTSIPPGNQVNPADIVFSNPAGSVGTTTSAPTSSASPSQPGQSIVLTSIVTPDGGATPTGTVTFIDGSTVLGSTPLDAGGKTNFRIASLRSGNHSITAVYQGSSTSSGSISTVFVQKVAGAPGIATSIRELPRTGIEALALALTGTVAILIGIAMELEGRRRMKVCRTNS